MNKRYIALLVITALLCVPTVSLAQTTTGLTVDEVVELALNNNLEIQALVIENQLVNRDLRGLEKWLDDALELMGITGIDPSFMSTYLSVVEPRTKALIEKSSALQDSLAIKKLRVAFDAEDAYYSLLTLSTQLSVQQALLSSLSSKYALEQERLAQGLTSALSVEILALRVAEANLALDKGRAGIATATMRLNGLLNRPLLEAIELQQAPVFEPVAVCLEESLAKAHEPLQGELKNARLNYSNSIEKYRYTSYLAAPTNILHPDIAALKVKQAEQAVEMSIRNKVNDVIYAEQAVSIAQQGLSIEKRKLEIEEKKHDLGLTTQLAVADQANIVAAKEADVLQKTYLYRRAVLILRLAEQGL